MENRAQQGIGNLTANIAAVGSAANALQDAVDALESLSGQGIEPQNLTAWRNAYNRVGTEMDRLITLRNSYAVTATTFREDLAQLRRSFPQNGDRNFLAFAVRLLEGRSDISV
jgi:hypothetical protein